MADIITKDPSILRQKSRITTLKEVRDLDLANRLKKIIDSGWVNGLGLAAIQVAIPIQYAWYRLGTRKPVELINPTLVKGEWLIPINGEGCLSVERQRFTTWRYQKISFINFDVESGKDKLFEVESLEAQVVLHEIDHMEGILVCDITRKPEETERNAPCPCGSGKKFKKCHQ